MWKIHFNVFSYIDFKSYTLTRILKDLIECATIDKMCLWSLFAFLKNNILCVCMSRCGMLSEFAVASAYTMYQIKSIAFFANLIFENIGHRNIHKSHLCDYEIALPKFFYFTSRAYFLDIKPLYLMLSWQYSNIRICARQYGFL